MIPEPLILVQIEADLPSPDRIQREQVEETVRQVLLMHELPDAAMISIVIGTDENIRAMNRKYRQLDTPTDILSFPAEPLPDGIDEDRGYLGDIVIGLPYAAARAQQEGHSIHDELALLLIHGTLHLLGYDHDTPEKQAEMWKVQAEALATLDIAMDVPAYVHD